MIQPLTDTERLQIVDRIRTVHETADGITFDDLLLRLAEIGMECASDPVTAALYTTPDDS